MVHQPTKELAQALRKVSDSVADPESDWNFSSPLTCNCGLLAKELGANGSDIENEVFGHWIEEVWETQKYESVEKYCQITGLPNKGVFKLLREHGLDDKDIENIEMLGRRYYWSDSNDEISSEPIYADEYKYRQVIAKGILEYASYVETVLQIS